MSRRREIEGPAGRLSIVELQPVGGGVGLPVLLVHGINMTADVWTEVQLALGESRRVVAFDLRGHGDSARSGPFTAEDYAEDALAVLDACGIDRAHVVGTSFGGSVAVALAVAAPERVATISSFGGMLAADGFDLDGAVAAIRGAGLHDFFAAFLPQASFRPGTDQALIERALVAATKDRDLDTVIAVSTAAFTADTTNMARTVTVPSLVVTGELDMTCPVPLGRQVADVLGTDHIVVPGAGHVVSMEEPETVAAMIQDHITAHEAELQPVDDPT